MVQSSLLYENISPDLFGQLLNKYGDLLESISSAKPAKQGQRTLSELDEFRYKTAVELFSSEKPQRAMQHNDVKSLVEWKLRHGKFRPTLMKLVSSNDEDTVADTLEGAMSAYWKAPDVTKAVDAIAKLKGIGPATASLLLSVHDPDKVIFFSDEAFYWLCHDAKPGPIKYNAKEYRDLNASAQKLAKRLDVSATDVEKVAFVLMRTNHDDVVFPRQEPPLPVSRSDDTSSEEGGNKRKFQKERDEITPPQLRRSKRGKT
ncbi:hypothetical protein PG995_003818 [Apiospora arundinis]|uniref:Uncharacterized protein n=1 Tax=Apiospora arundinis TaxID=335852 RepID=A0ABR2HR31_9PEZI